MSVSKNIGIVTGAIPVLGLLIGGVTFGVNFKTDVDNVKKEVAKQETINTSLEERFAAIPLRYDDTTVWNAIDNLYIPEEYDDTFVTDRLQQLDVDLVELRTRLEGLDFGAEEYDDSYIRSRLAELDGSLNALANIEMDSNGDVDISSLVVQIASVEGTVQGIKNTLSSIQTQISTLERNKVRAYDDSSLKSSIRTVTSNISDIERRLNNVGSSSGSSSTTRVENPYDDTSIKNDIRNLRSDIQALQRDRGVTYDDSSLRASIRTLQNEISTLQTQLNSISNQPTQDARVDSLLSELQSIKNNVEDRIEDIEHALDNTHTDTTSDHRFNEFEDELREEFHWTMEQFYFEINDLRNQVYSLQETVDFLGSNVPSNNTTSDNYTSTEPPYWLKITHIDSNGNHTYTGDYYFDGYYDGQPMWVNWECGTPGGQWEFCFIFKYNGASWVLQPLPPSTEWLANSYTDGQWPWSGAWSGDVQHVEVIE